MKWTEKLVSSNGCHGHQENGVFVVSMATVSKGRKSFVYFRRLMWANIPSEFQPKATICSLEKMSQPVSLFPVIRTIYHSDGFLTTRNGSEFYDSLMFRRLWQKNASGTSMFSVWHVWVNLIMKGAGPRTNMFNEVAFWELLLSFWNVASFNIFLHDVINLLYHEH